ncbi:MAG: type II toxin-antitoxin system prevent-host-death family antitoxin [Bifidobacteriaceae bacterium]|jgi:prevent-host-death family protein|nr:type II toxin-antitoxin system prevent-host-death family antitoxin [Bifidobacteriaceae bacterium]
MATITQRQLRNESASIMDRLEQGEQFTVTRGGRPVATLAPLAPLAPLAGRRRAVPSEELLAAMADLPPLDFAQLRAEADTFFGDEGDRVG